MRWLDLLLITVAMVGARTFAMAANRILDRRIDARNPRTANRELVTGAVSVRTAWTGAAVALVVFLVLMLSYGYYPTANFLAVIPLILLSSCLALGVGLWLGPINVQFRDVKHTLPFILQVWMYASPIIYPLSVIPEKWKWLYSLNPMVGVIEGFRWALLGRGDPDFGVMALSVVLIVALLVSGLIFFKRMERTFADLV